MSNEQEEYYSPKEMVTELETKGYHVAVMQEANNGPSKFWYGEFKNAQPLDADFINALEEMNDELCVYVSNKFKKPEPSLPKPNPAYNGQASAVETSPELKTPDDKNKDTMRNILRG